MPHSFNGLDTLSLVIGITGIIAGAAGVLLNFLNKDRYQTQVDVYKPENEELRAISARKTTDLAVLKSENDILRAEAGKMGEQIKDLKELNSKQPDFSSLMSVMSNNHKAVMIKLSSIAGKAMKQ